MTNEELILMYREGDMQALEVIIKQNKGLVHMIANRFKGYCNATLELDDLMQEGNIGLLIAVDRYEFNIVNKAKFSVYAFYWIKQRIYKQLKYMSKKKIEVSLSATTGEGLTLGEQLKDKEDCILKAEESLWYQELKVEIANVMNQELTARQREVTELRYGFSGMEPATLKEIAEIMEISKSGADSILETSLRKMRRSKWGRSMLLENNRDREIYIKYYC